MLSLPKHTNLKEHSTLEGCEASSPVLALLAGTASLIGPDGHPGASVVKMLGRFSVTVVARANEQGFLTSARENERSKTGTFTSFTAFT